MVDIGGCQVIQALEIAVFVVVFDEGAVLPFQVAWQDVVFQENPVLYGLVTALDLAQGLRDMRRTTDIIHALTLYLVGQIRGGLRCAVVA